MPKSSEIHDGRVEGAVKVIQQKNFKISLKLRGNSGSPIYQEEALVRWITKMRDLNLPVTI
ncbi:hypothetical protein EYZ11_007400 [Aspergillus tanneri]|uniref:HTH CENPB-type domain-containing protein n=1 Tax=Aspergillus tanneri TaxID=1220188 RepID=A0A4S3JDA8_9EURO|nr:hypothetical protein EYZ11_007400 [Aspergillus tanneri]